MPRFARGLSVGYRFWPRSNVVVRPGKDVKLCLPSRWQRETMSVVNHHEGLKRAWGTVLPAPQTATVVATILRLTNQRPTLGAWNWIIDIREPYAQATAEELERLGAVFNAFTVPQSYTIFASNDPATPIDASCSLKNFRTGTTVWRRGLPKGGSVFW